MNTPLIIAFLVCVTIFLVFFWISSYLNYRRTREDWMERVRGEEKETSSEQLSESSSTTPKPFFQVLSVLGEATKPQSEEERSRVRRTLSQAGYRRAEAPLIFFGARLCFAMLLPAVFTLLRTSTLRTLPYTQTMLFFVLVALVGFYIPNIWLWIKIKRRQRALFEGFPDALDLMVACVEAGLGLDGAISRVGEEMQLSNKAVSEEFKLVNLELRAGQSRQNALRSLSLRTGLEDINNLAALLIQTDRFGTSVAQALRVHAESMRTRRLQRAEEIAAKLPVKLLFPLIFFIFPSLFVVILGPAVIQIFRILLPTLSGGQ